MVNFALEQELRDSLAALAPPGLPILWSLCVLSQVSLWR